MLLSRAFIRHGEDIQDPLDNASFPERVLQIGEGNFLRGFADWLIHQLNQHGLFQGSIVVVAPRPSGGHNIDRLNRQDGLYTVWLRGLHDGQRVDRKDMVTSVRRGINPYTHWNEFLACAENRNIDIILSNTTESGLVYVPEPYERGRPITSNPGKLTAYLYHRYRHFGGDPSAGVTVIPCELVDDNGILLRKLVERYAADWRLPDGFVDWIRTANRFCNTLVDRIVTGFPESENKSEVFANLGYEDHLLTVAEPFHLWVIQGDGALSAVWPFEQLGLNVKYADPKPYRLRKVRILNGAHTAMSAIAHFAGIPTVREVVEDPDLGAFIRDLIFQEILPTLESKALDRQSLNAFADSVLERFANPYVRHEIQSLMLNGLSKIRVRLLPTLTEYVRRRGKLPERLTFAIAALLLYFRNADQPEHRWEIPDNQEHVQLLQEIWSRESARGLSATVERLLAVTEIWGQDLNTIPQFAERVTRDIASLRSEGVRPCIAKTVHR
ncbi:tagaturonate reductase [Alicyclobacillus pomorum]|uniref:tagaturonate reductase n=1 Tax=Alicyclobacillus pomorum TaxID=204470 RepID=UPI0004078D26|nr:tagaturonate reductase [Alicyclobacillus pomorum]